MSKRQPVIGICRICGEEKTLTEEHIIPRVAGGGTKVKLYSGDELLKTIGGEDKPYGKIKQNGHTAFTLCKDCNSLAGAHYDDDFALLFKKITYGIQHQVAIPQGVNRDEFLEDGIVDATITGIKPFNIAKRILVAFCSVEHTGLTNRKPEIRKAILDKDYQPNTDDFSIYLSLHLGRTVAALMNLGENYVPVAYAGIETDLLAFHLAGHDEHLKGGPLINCLDITSWLTRYTYDQIVNVQLELMFNKSLMIRFPIPQG